MSLPPVPSEKRYSYSRYTNFGNVDGRRISVPKTAHVTSEKETNITTEALEAIKGEYRILVSVLEVKNHTNTL